MDIRYNRNKLYIDNSEQEMISRYPVILGGAGIGSVIAECALRLGFENLTIVDHDSVELSNLNRQNYTENDLKSKKVEALKDRLKSINNRATIKVYDKFMTGDNIYDLVKNHKVAVNALDFSTEAPLEFDRICRELSIPIIHPYNLGWAGLVTVIDEDSPPLDVLRQSNESFSELNMVEYAVSYLRFWGKPQLWLEDIINKFKNKEHDESPPQLSVGAWLVASMCTQIMFGIVTGKAVKYFPEFYYSDSKFMS